MMKCIRFLAFLLLSLLLLSSCESRNPGENILPSDKCIYRMASGEAMSFDYSCGVPILVDPIHGITTSVCRDPLCMHDTEECPFYDCQGCAADGSILFFRRGSLQRNENGAEGSETLCTYNPQNGRVRSLCDYAGRMVYAGIHKNVLYYYLAEFSADADGISCRYRLFRADGIIGEVTELNLPEVYQTTGGYVNNCDYPNLLSFDENSIYWMEFIDDQNVQYYKTDLYHQNKQLLWTGGNTCRTFFGGYGYSVTAQAELIDPDAGRREDNIVNTYSIHRTDLSDGTETVIAEHLMTPVFLVTEHSIFTMEGIPVAKNGALLIDLCKINRMNHDGSNPVPIAETDRYTFMAQPFSGAGVFAGYYEDENNTFLALTFCSDDENSSGKYSSDTLILDTENGLFTVSQYEN